MPSITTWNCHTISHHPDLSTDRGRKREKEAMLERGAGREVGGVRWSLASGKMPMKLYAHPDNYKTHKAMGGPASEDLYQ